VLLLLLNNRLLTAVLGVRVKYVQTKKKFDKICGPTTFFSQPKYFSDQICFANQHLFRPKILSDQNKISTNKLNELAVSS
jgi:hypothetical protein